MSKHEKTLEKILSGRADANISFSDATTLLTRLGFVGRIRGSHHVFTNGAVLVNLQSHRGKVPTYQVAQMRAALKDAPIK